MKLPDDSELDVPRKKMRRLLVHMEEVEELARAYQRRADEVKELARAYQRRHSILGILDLCCDVPRQRERQRAQPWPTP